MIRTCIAIAILALLVPAARVCAVAPPDQKKIDAIIQQLGDKSQHDAAAAQLRSIGSRALSSLERAMGDPDASAEIRNEAATLVSQIQQNLDKQIREIIGRKIPAANDVQGSTFFEITSDDLDKLFPKHRFFGLRFRQFPVAHQPTEPFQVNNIFVMKPDGSVLDATVVNKLQEFFQDTVKIDTQPKAKLATRAWLRLAEELYNDGFYRFTIPDEGITVTTNGVEIKTMGKSVATGRGNSGQITVELKFEQGQLLSVDQSSKLREGPRPICQSSKLLDPDPIVRKMAEQCLLTMGASAWEYLFEQRQKASPELRDAIDRIWQRIVQEGR